jgi:hypothetical protein
VPGEWTATRDRPARRLATDPTSPAEIFIGPAARRRGATRAWQRDRGRRVCASRTQRQPVVSIRSDGEHRIAEEGLCEWRGRNPRRTSRCRRPCESEATRVPAQQTNSNITSRCGRRSARRAGTPRCFARSRRCRGHRGTGALMPMCRTRARAARDASGTRDRRVLRLVPTPDRDNGTSRLVVARVRAAPRGHVGASAPCASAATELGRGRRHRRPHAALSARRPGHRPLRTAMTHSSSEPPSTSSSPSPTARTTRPGDGPRGFRSHPRRLAARVGRTEPDGRHRRRHALRC